MLVKSFTAQKASEDKAVDSEERCCRIELDLRIWNVEVHSASWVAPVEINGFCTGSRTYLDHDTCAVKCSIEM